MDTNEIMENNEVMAEAKEIVKVDSGNGIADLLIGFGIGLATNYIVKGVGVLYKKWKQKKEETKNEKAAEQDGEVIADSDETNK